MPLPTGLYKISFATPAGQEHGVAYLTADGRVRGGDSGMAYVGTYAQDGGRFSAELTVTQHRHVPGFTSLLGYNDLTVQLDGDSEDYSAAVRGTCRDAPSVRFQARLSHIAD